MRFSGILLGVAAAQQVVSSRQSPVQQDATVRPKRIAIIGAGAAGSSAAHSLRKYANQSDFPISITIFERRPYIGGRSTTVHPFNDTSQRPVELGASIFVSANKILQDAVEEFGLQPKEPYSTGTHLLEDGKEEEGEKLPFMGIYDGSGFVVKMADASWWSGAKMLWRYGMAPYYADKLMGRTVAKFLKIYEAPHFPFASLTKSVYDLGLADTVAITGSELLRENGISGRFGDEVLQAMTRVNYGINLGAVHGLEAMVSIATNGAMAVEGGNWRMFEGMIKRSGADLRLNTAVKRVQRHEDGTFTITSRTVTDTGAKSTEEDFDTLILAAPYQYSDLVITPKPRIVPDTIPYVNLHVTLFTSPHYLSSSYFGLPPNERVPRMLLTTLQPSENPGTDPFYSPLVPFTSISLQGTRFHAPSNTSHYLYKIFSISPISDEFLGEILGVKGNVEEKDVSWVVRKLWQSYPYEVPRVGFEEARLDEGVWYTGGMEAFISCMETSALMGKNVAKLVVEGWVGERDASKVAAAKARPDVLEQFQAEL